MAGSTKPNRWASAPPASTSTTTEKVKEICDSLRNPVYLVEHAQVMAVDAPDDLREGG